MHGCIERRSRRKSGKRSFRRVVTVATVSGRNQPAALSRLGGEMTHCVISFSARSSPFRRTQNKKEQLLALFCFGAPPGTRTLGPLIKSQLLYQLS